MKRITITEAKFERLVAVARTPWKEIGLEDRAIISDLGRVLSGPDDRIDFDRGVWIQQHSLPSMVLARALVLREAERMADGHSPHP